MYDDYSNGGGVYSGQKYEYSTVSAGGTTGGSDGHNPSGDSNNSKKGKGKKKGGFFAKAFTALILGVIFGAAAALTIYLIGYFTDYGNATEATVAKEQQLPVTELPGKTEVQDEKEDESSEEAQEVLMAVTDVSDMVEKVMPSVVSIKGNYTYTTQGFFGQTYTQEAEGSGSGIILANDGNKLFVCTNNHVVEDAVSLEVQFIDGHSAPASVKGTDPDMDLAVIMINLEDIDSETMSKIAVAQMGDSADVKVGQPAVAIGNALGYGQSVTCGVISALDRTLTTSDTGETYNGLIQTDAAINPGNSGGALLNVEGQVIGINSSKIGGTTIDGVGFAIPISNAVPILSDIVESTERVKVSEGMRGYLGIGGVSVTEEASEMYNMPVGVLVRTIYEDTGAAASELQVGDIITKLGTKKIKSMEDLHAELEYYAVNENVSVTVLRFEDGEYVEKKIEFALSDKDKFGN